MLSVLEVESWLSHGAPTASGCRTKTEKREAVLTGLPLPLGSQDVLAGNGQSLSGSS